MTWASILLNGQPTGNTILSPQYPNLPAYGWFPVTITNGFVCGMNCLDFYVTNALGGDQSHRLSRRVDQHVQRLLLHGHADRCFPCTAAPAPTGSLPAGAPDPQVTLTCVPPGVSATTPVVIDPSLHSRLLDDEQPELAMDRPRSVRLRLPAGFIATRSASTFPARRNVPIRASLTGQWTADDTGTIYLNGVPTGNTLPERLGLHQLADDQHHQRLRVRPEHPDLLRHQRARHHKLDRPAARADRLGLVLPLQQHQLLRRDQLPDEPQRHDL